MEHTVVEVLGLCLPPESWQAPDFETVGVELALFSFLLVLSTSHIPFTLLPVRLAPAPHVP